MRIMIIRHAEKPDRPEGGAAVTATGAPDPESLTIRGWQRAGALARFFCPRPANPDLQPQAVFAAGVGHASPSKRPSQTVTPLMSLLNETGHVPLVTTHLKDDLQPLIEDVLARQGPVLIAWEHKRIPDLVALLPDAPVVPQCWPDDRYDIVWILDRKERGWTFTQLPQLLLAGDSPDPVAGLP